MNQRREVASNSGGTLPFGSILVCWSGFTMDYANEDIELTKLHLVMFCKISLALIIYPGEITYATF